MQEEREMQIEEEISLVQALSWSGGAGVLNSSAAL
jgi:hypothetical protein